MLCNKLGRVVSIGDSGRIVVELPPQMKRELYAALSRDGLTLKAWLISRAEDYVGNNGQISLFKETERLHNSAWPNAIEGSNDE